jgi:hypothetical protein
MYANLLTPLLLFFVIFFSNTIFYLGLGSSLAVGTSISAIIIIFFSFCTNQIRIKKVIGRDILIVSLVILLNLGIAATFSHLNIEKALISYLLVLLFYFSAYTLSIIISQTRKKYIDQTMFCLLYILYFASFVAITKKYIIPSYETIYVNPIFPFVEPSLFAMIFTPVLLYCLLISGPKHASLMVILAFLILIFIKSLILGLGLIFSLLLTRKYYFLFYLSLSFLALCIYLNFDYQYYLDRLIISEDNKNLSHLVFLQGWSILFESIKSSFSLGIGFQQLGFAEIDWHVINQVTSIVGRPINNFDGGFLFSKFISEFGIFGFLFFILLSRNFFLAFRNLYYFENKSINSNFFLFKNIFLISFIFDFFIRTAGYFSPASFLFLTAILLPYDGGKN